MVKFLKFKIFVRYEELERLLSEREAQINFLMNHLQIRSTSERTTPTYLKSRSNTQSPLRLSELNDSNPNVGFGSISSHPIPPSSSTV